MRKRNIWITGVFLWLATPLFAAPWQKAALTGGEVAVLMPGQPKATKAIDKTDWGPFATTTLMLVQRPVVYVAVCSELPPDQAVLTSQNHFDSFLKDMLTPNGKMLGQRSFTKGNHSGIAYKIKDPDGLLYRGQIFVVGHRFYSIAVNIYAEDEKAATPQIEKYFASLQIAAAPPSPAATWKRFPLPEAGFAVTFPGEPRPIKVDISPRQPRTTEKITIYQAFVSYGKQAAFLIGYNAFPTRPDITTEQAFTDFQAGLLNGAGSVKLLSEKPIALGQWPGREIKFRNGRGLYQRSRILWIDQKMFTLSVIVAPERETAVQKDIEKFFDSFEIPAPQTPPQTAPATAPAAAPAQ